MSIRVLELGRDVLSEKPYRITCSACDTAFSFIEKDAVKEFDGAGFDRLSVSCPNCGKNCVTGVHKPRKVKGAKDMTPEDRARSTGLEVERGRIKRPPEYTKVKA